MVDWSWILSSCKRGAELMNVIESSKENFYINLGKKFNNPSACKKMY